MNNPENSKMATVKSFKTVGIDAVPVKVEVAKSPGIGISLIGLADIAVKESLLRSVTALQAIGYRFPGAKIVRPCQDWYTLRPPDNHRNHRGKRSGGHARPGQIHRRR